MFNMDKFLLIKLDDIYIFLNKNNILFNESDAYIYLILSNMYMLLMIMFCLYAIITIYNMLLPRDLRKHNIFWLVH